MQIKQDQIQANAAQEWEMNDEGYRLNLICKMMLNTSSDVEIMK